MLVLLTALLAMVTTSPGLASSDKTLQYVETDGETHLQLKSYGIKKMQCGAKTIFIDIGLGLPFI